MINIVKIDYQVWMRLVSSFVENNSSISHWDAKSDAAAAAGLFQGAQNVYLLIKTCYILFSFHFSLISH